MSASSPVVICNRALTACGANTIVSFGDGTTEANLCALHYPTVRDAVTAAYQWTHAIKRFGPLVPDAATPAFGFTYQYILPSDLLTLTAVHLDDRLRQIPEYEVEGGRLLTNIGSGLFIKYIAQITDTTRFVQMYTEALIARLAAEFAIPLAESKTLAQFHFQAYERKVDEAAAVDGLQGLNKRTNTVNHLRARFGDPRHVGGFYSAGS
jgi:hypothetical protein